MRSSIASILAVLLFAPGAAFAQSAVPPPPPPPAAPVAPAPAPLPPAPGAGVAPAAPSTAAPPENATASSEDTDAPTPGAAAGAKEPPFYRPSSAELALAPPKGGYPMMVTLMEDTHLFVNGSIRNFGSETRARIGGNFGFTIGTFNFNTIGVGFDGFQFNGIRLVASSPEGLPFDIYMMLPNLAFRGYALPGRWGVALGTSLTGVRVANCALTGCFEASVRLLTVDAWGAGDFNQASFALSVGGGITAGIKL